MSALRKFWYLYKLRKNVRLNQDQLMKLQEKKMRMLIDYAYNNVEYYHKKFDSLGLKPENVDFYFQSERSNNAKKSNAFYKLAGRVAKHVTMNEIKAIYGDVNPGKIMSSIRSR